MTDYGRARIWDNDNSKWLDLVGNPVGGVVEGIVFDGDLHVTGDIYSGAVGNEGDELHVGPLDGDLDGYIDDKLALYLPLAGGTMTGAILGAAGTESAPGYAFAGDSNTGMYRRAASQLGFSIAGVEGFFLTSNAVTFGTNSTGDPRIKLNGGSAAEPSYGFAGDTDTGMYRGGENQIRFATGGAFRAWLDTIGFGFGDRTTGNAQISTPQAAAPGASAPAYSFFGDTDTGMYRAGTDQVGIALGGVEKMVAFSNGTRFGGTTTGLSRITNTATSASAPTYSFNGDTDTGMYRSGADALNFTTGGTSRLTLSTSAATFGSGFTVSVQGGATNGQLWYRSNPEAQSGNAAVWFSDGGVYKLVRTSSLREHKTDERLAPELADIKLDPYRFRRIGEDFFQYGVMVDDLVKQDEDLGIWNEEEKRYDDFFDRGLMAVMIAKINRLEGLVL